MNVVDLDPSRTIVAIASPPGPSIRGIVRISGPDVLACLNAIAWSVLFAPKAAMSFTVPLRIDGIGTPVPARILLWPDERSYTRQPSAEIHVLGSGPLLEAIIETLCRCGAARARPGEFTLRAFLAGRLDLTQAEAIIGAVEAASAEEFKLALAQSTGGLSRPLDRFRDELLNLVAHLEAGLDFVEDDIEFISAADLERELVRIAESLASLQSQISQRFVSTAGWRVVLIGRPNAGKSSLFNALAGRAAAIANETAGTTRDYLGESLLLEGLPVQLVDSAGLDASLPDAAAGHFENSISHLAQNKTRELIQTAHLQILCIERGRPLDAWERNSLLRAAEHCLVVATKSDQGLVDPQPDWICTSAVADQGIDELKSAIAKRLRGMAGDLPVLPSTASRCAEPLAAADEALVRAVVISREGGGEELVAAELRVALDELGKIVGAIFTDDILDRVFSRFCIGK